MNTKEMDKLMAHFDKYFKQSDCQVLHPLAMTPHIDTLVYKPTDELPYWKLVSMGASDYRMPAKKAFLGDRNEYMMFIDAQEDLNDKETLDRYVMYLIEIARYPISNHCYITYGHSVEWKPEDDEESDRDDQQQVKRAVPLHIGSPFHLLRTNLPDQGGLLYLTQDASSFPWHSGGIR